MYRTRHGTTKKEYGRTQIRERMCEGIKQKDNNLSVRELERDAINIHLGVQMKVHAFLHCDWGESELLASRLITLSPE